MMKNPHILGGEQAEPKCPRRALIVAFDGAPPEAIQKAATPHIDRLLKEGAYTWRAQTTLPTWSLQCYVSILAGVPADAYELSSDPEGWLEPRKYPVSSLFDLAHEAGLKTAMFNNWHPLNDLPRPGTVDTMFSSEEESAVVTTAAAECLRRDKPELCFVHFDDPDAAGHEYGWRSAEQCAAVARCDKQLGILLSALEEVGTREESLVFVVSDHGGGKISNFGHGDAENPDYSHPLTTTVPWICCGPGIKHGHEIRTEVSICDTAATVAFMLGFEIPEAWQGKVVRDALSIH
ncbi:MAG: alkaline phosphatase family protein [Candidatus Latescibacteria bacterium]|nr:alkaline phosphatase family protein [Candidatus Latescibacterota bacterium]